MRIRWRKLVLFAVISLLLFVFYVALNYYTVINQIGEPPIVDDHLSGWRTPPQWIPDGKQIVFSYRGAIYAVDSGGTNLHRTHGWDHENDIHDSPSLSTDGTRVAYLKRHQDWVLDDYHWEVATSALDGTRERILTDMDGNVSSPSWFPGRRTIAFLSLGSVHTVTDDGASGPALIGGVSEEPPRYERWLYETGVPLAWSPDGRRVAFVGGTLSAQVFRERNVTVYQMEADGSGREKIAEEASMPAWSPDGTRLAFVSHAWDEQREVSCAKSLHVVDTGGSDPREIVTLPKGLQWNRIASWSPDGYQILVGPFVVNADGSTLQLLPHPDRIRLADNWEPMPDHYSQTSWSPDGSRVAIQTTADYYYHTKLYTVAPDGSDSRVLVVTDYDGNISAGGGGPLREHPVERAYYEQAESTQSEKKP